MICVRCQNDFVLFADDRNTLQQLVEGVTTEMTSLKIWFDLHKLSLNLNKTKSMLFGHRKINIRLITLILKECMKIHFWV